MRWNPTRGDLRSRALKPYLAVGLGPIIGVHSGVAAGDGTAFVGSRTRATIGGHLGAGVDAMLGRSWSLGVGVGYNWMADFSRPVGARDNYSGLDVGVSLGWLFGRGYALRQ